MAKRSIEIELDLQNRQAQRALKQTAESLGDVEDALDESESAGKRMARAIERAADDMIDEIDETARAVKALERALGPEFDADTREVVADLKAIGLTAQDIEADADDLALALKRSEDVKVHATEAGFKDLGQAVGSVREETGKTRDTMTGFIGGTVGELPGISEAMGPVAEGLGQLAEGALEGQINFKQLALAGGAMAGVAFVLGRVQKQMQRVAEARAWKREQVDDYAKALRGAEDAAAAVAEKLSDSEELVINLGNGLLEIDAVPILAQAGVDIEQFSQLVAGGEEKINEYAAAMEASGVESDAWKGVVAAATQEAGFFAEAQESAAAASAVFGEAQEDAQADLSGLKDALEDAKEETADLTAELYGLVDGAFDLETATMNLADEVGNFAKQQLDTAAIVMDAKSTDEEKAAALRDLRRAEIDVADAALETASAYATEQGATAGTTEYARLQIDKLRELQRTYPENRAEIQRYIDRLEAVPDTVSTTLSADASSANSTLSNLRGQLDDFRRRSTSVISGWLGGGRRFAAGTSGAPSGVALVGEQGPELVNLPAGSQVRNAGATDRILQGGGGRTTNVYVTQHFPAGVNERDVARATRRYEQVQGPM